MVRDRIFKRSAILATISACAMLSACGHTHGFSLAASGQAAAPASAGNDGVSGSNASATNGTNGSNGTNGNNGDNGGGDSIGATPLSALLLTPVTAFSGETVERAGDGISGLGAGVPVGAVGRITNRLGQVVSNVGAGLADDGLGGLPLVGGGADSLVGVVDSSAGSLVNIAAGGQSYGGDNALLGLGALSPGAPGSLGGVDLLTNGNLVTASLSSASIGSALGQAPTGALSNIAPLDGLNSVVGITALNQQVGGSNPLIAVNASNAPGVTGSLLPADALTNGGLTGAALTPTTSGLPAVTNLISQPTNVTGSTIGTVNNVVGGVQGLLGF